MKIVNVIRSELIGKIYMSKPQILYIQPVLPEIASNNYIYQETTLISKSCFDENYLQSRFIST